MLGLAVKPMARIIYMRSFSRSGETLLLRHLNAHPDLQAGYDLTDLEQASLKKLLREKGLRKLSKKQCRVYKISKSNVIAKTIWKAGNLPGFALSRHPLSVIASILSNFAIMDRAGQFEKIEEKSRKIDRLCGYVDPAFLSCLPGSRSLDDIALKIALAWSRQMADAYRSGIPRIRYEDFVKAPAAELERLCDALGVKFHKGMINAERNYPDGQIGHGLIKLSRPIDPALAFGKIDVLTDRQVEIVRMVCAETMEMFGYHPDPLDA